eukprot:TRINITY_DN4928_c0_g1_i1.p1 TRINITY_DN4928_c0_g1~~TRINITY_DN4928_c0_g1_i1.p1  ORF type:complete len:371 (+),score=7.85 TRINITY_DN4928_c0_g1_i1:39-1115(+)
MASLTISNDHGIQFQLGKVIGEGRSGCVRECFNAVDGSLVDACKTVSASTLDQPNAVSNVLSELHAMETLKGHENIVNLVDIGFDDSGAHLVMEFCKEGSLYEFFVAHTKLSESQVAYIMRQILLALCHCHQNGIIHRDVKPENILLKNYHPSNSSHSTGSKENCELCLPSSADCKAHQKMSCLKGLSLKLADFGFATTFSTDRMQVSGLYGTSWYMAPEVVTGKFYGPEVDLWSAGVVCFTALGGFMPFFGHDDVEIFQSIIEANPKMNCGRWLHISENAKDFVCKLLSREPKVRLTAESALSHPWLVENLKIAQPTVAFTGHTGEECLPLLKSVSPSSSLDLPTSPPAHQKSSLSI